ncbi:MAG: hypothetical protein KKG78_08670, partial [Alphaproteobacteria bacterium]|nr:hypothetical protein [Alphaproteobacteria bacterium]
GGGKVKHDEWKKVRVPSQSSLDEIVWTPGFRDLARSGRRRGASAVSLARRSPERERPSSDDYNGSYFSASLPVSPGLDVFSAPASSKSSHDALHRACGFSSLTRKILSTKSLPAKDDWL